MVGLIVLFTFALPLLQKVPVSSSDVDSGGRLPKAHVTQASPNVSGDPFLQEAIQELTKVVAEMNRHRLPDRSSSGARLNIHHYGGGHDYE